MALDCPHCDKEVKKLKRTGDKRYSCDECSMVIAYDDLSPHLDEIEVDDRRGNLGQQKKRREKKEQEQEQQQDEEHITSQSSKSERDIIAERGYEGLKEIKQRKLKKWLAASDGVGGKTESRIMMVFNSDEIYSQEPSALYNLLDDELSASPSYINTIVNNVYAPEYEHSDLLEKQGYQPYFGNGNDNMNNGFNRNGSNQQNMGQSQQQMQNAQQSQGGSASLTREEALEMITAANQQEESGSRRRGPATEALDEATEVAIKSAAENMGGLFGTLQRIGEEALLQYFRENPEKLVDNMALLQAFMGNNENKQETNNEPAENKKIDDAMNMARQVDSTTSSQQASSNGQASAFRYPDEEEDTTQTTQPNNDDTTSEFTPDPEIIQSGGTTPDESGSIDDYERDNTSDPSDWDDDEPSTDSPDNSDSSIDIQKDIGGDPGGEEDDEFDELFGDLE